jgi:hypothetical protein
MDYHHSSDIKSCLGLLSKIAFSEDIDQSARDEFLVIVEKIIALSSRAKA